MENNTKKAKRLFILWVVSYMLFNFGSSFYVSYQQVFTENDPTVFVSGFHLFVLGLLTLYFIPLLGAVRHLLKKSPLVKMYKIVSVLCIWLISSTGMLLFCIIFASAFPDVFARITSLN